MNPDSSQYLLPQAISFTGAILLDVENFPLKIDLAHYLKPYCQSPITVKFAVANWQNSCVAKLDKYLHQQRYQLIHVPKDKNAADAQILTLGASLQLNYPQVKEVIIVSHDSIFNYLHQTLQRQGCNTYKVYQHSGSVYLDNFVRADASVIAQIPHATQEQNIAHSIKSKIELTLNKLIQELKEPVSLSQLSSQYKKDYQQSISEALKSNKISKSASNFIIKSCAQTIKIEQKNKVYYLSTKKL